MLSETGSLDGNVTSTARSSFLFRFGCEFSGRALSVRGTILLLGSGKILEPADVEHCRVPDVLKRLPGQRS